MWKEVEIEDTRPERPVLGLECSGKMTETEFEAMHAWLHGKLGQMDRPSLVLSLGNFQGYDDLSALWADFRLDTKHGDDFRRIAVVADQAWLKWATKVADPVLSSKLKWFAEDERAAAEAWAR